jgi:hypothetical protein
MQSRPRTNRAALSGFCTTRIHELLRARRNSFPSSPSSSANEKTGYPSGQLSDSRTSIASQCPCCTQPTRIRDRAPTRRVRRADVVCAVSAFLRTSSRICRPDVSGPMPSRARHSRGGLAPIILAVLCAVLGTPVSPAQAEPGPECSVAWIHSGSVSDSTVCNGVWLDPTSVLTCRHSVQLSEPILIKRQSGAFVTATVVKHEYPDRDLIVLGVGSGIAGRSFPLRRETISSPTQGTLFASDWGRPISRRGLVNPQVKRFWVGSGELYRFTAPLWMGLSGAPVFDDQGQIMAIAGAVSSTARGYVIPVAGLEMDPSDTPVSIENWISRTARLPHAEGMARFLASERCIGRRAYPEAKVALEDAVRLGVPPPYTPIVLRTLAHVLGELGDTSAALTVARRAAAIPSRDPSPLLALGRADLEVGNWIEAEVIYRRAIDRAPDDVDGLLGLAATQLRLGLAKDALASFSEVIVRDRDSVDARVGAGYALLALRDVSGARGYFRDATALDPESSDAWYYLGIVAVDQLDKGLLGEVLAPLGRLAPQKADDVRQRWVVRAR